MGKNVVDKFIKKCWISNSLNGMKDDLLWIKDGSKDSEMDQDEN